MKQMANRRTLTIFGVGLATVALAGELRADFVDDLDTTNNMTGGFGYPIVTNNGDGTVSVIKTLAEEDTGINWHPGGGQGSWMVPCHYETIQIEPRASHNGGYYGANLQFADSTHTYIGEATLIADTQSTNVFTTNIADFIENSGFGTNEVWDFSLRIRVNTPWLSNDTGFVFDRIAVTSAPPPSPPLLAHEPFDYSSGSDLGTLDGGTGWYGGWMSATNIGLNTSSSLYSQAFPMQPVGGRIEDTGGDSGFRMLDYPLNMVSDLDYYVSFLYRREAGDNWNGLSFSRNQYNEDLFIGSSGAYRFHMNHIGGAVSQAGLSNSVTYFYVAKIDASVYDAMHVYLKVYEPTDVVHESDTELSGEGSAATNWTLIAGPETNCYTWDRIRVASDSGVDYSLDELRIGTTWLSVTAPPPGDPGTVLMVR